MSLPIRKFTKFPSTIKENSPQANASPSPNRKSNSIDIIDNLLFEESNRKNLKNLYQNIGTKVSKLKEMNEAAINNIDNQGKQIKLLDERIKAKKKFIEEELRGQGKGRKGIKLHDTKQVKELYDQMVAKGVMHTKININHVQNDPELKKLYSSKEIELSQLQNRLNKLIKSTEYYKNEINTLRIENNKHKINLQEMSERQARQNAQMDKISEDANKYLKEKGNINKELVHLNDLIDLNRVDHEKKIEELNKMIDTTKKIKEFHENLAVEKFSSSSFKRASSSSPGKPMNKILEVRTRLNELKGELENKKKTTVYYNFLKLIVLKKQEALNNIIDKIKHETGIENLDKLSSDLQLSVRTNKLFANDIKCLQDEKEALEGKIAMIKKEIESLTCVLNDTTTKKLDNVNKIQDDLKAEEEKREKLSKRLFVLNRVTDLITIGFNESCTKLNFFDPTLKFEGQNNEETLAKCMEFLEKKMIEVIQLNTDPLKDTNLNFSQEEKNVQMLEKVCENLFLDDKSKFLDLKKFSSNNIIPPKDIKDLAKEIVGSYIKKYEKTNIY